MAVICIIFLPVQVWAEENAQWNELRKWKELNDNIIPVLIVRDAKISQQHVDMVEDVINSKQIKKSGRTLYLGWNEGIRVISESFGVKVPTLQIQNKLEGPESITIYLMDKSSNEGYNGYTDLFYDSHGNIQKAFVKIYNTDELGDTELESIVRHELGHALGLGHTDAKNDLMQPVINMNHNAISILDLLALVSIY